jgi:hypothetical protein
MPHPLLLSVVVAAQKPTHKNTKHFFFDELASEPHQ